MLIELEFHIHNALRRSAMWWCQVDRRKLLNPISERRLPKPRYEWHSYGALVAGEL